MDKKERIEMLECVLGIIDRNPDYVRGICYRIDLLPLHYPQLKVKQFREWFKTQKPHSNFHSKFAKHNTFTGTEWWWCRTQEGLEQRILFIKHLIEYQSK